MLTVVISSVEKTTFVATLGAMTFTGKYEIGRAYRGTGYTCNILITQKFKIHTEQDEYTIIDESMPEDIYFQEESIVADARSTIETYFKELIGSRGGRWV